MKKEKMKRPSGKDYSWDLSRFYSSPRDPKIEKDMQRAEKAFNDFAHTYDITEKTYLQDNQKLLEALIAYEALHAYAMPAPIVYFFFLQSLNSQDDHVNAQYVLLSSRMTKVGNLVKFFPLSLGTLGTDEQQEILRDQSLTHFHFFLSCVFSDAKHQLSLVEEKILSLKHQPAKEMWVTHNDKILDSQSLTWKNKKLSINRALELISVQPTSAQRHQLARNVYNVLKSVAVFSEGEINAIYTDKKINDELRGYTLPYEETVNEYRNDITVVERLRQVVTDNFSISHRFGAIHARMLKQKKLHYSDRAASIGRTKTTYTFEQLVDLLKKTFANVDPSYARILEQYVKEGRIDAFPRQGKTGGAFCAGTYANPTYILLNHVDSLRSYTTLAHEMGHAFHTEMSRSQGPLYSDYSYALAETASTLFESIAFDAIIDTLPIKERVVMIHDKINNSISTIMRQIACFNFELELHNTIRSKGFVPKEEIAALHNKNMQAYLGPAYKLIPEDGYMFVSWGHIRRFFYVYSYAYGLIMSQAMLRRYRADKSFWKSIERFLKAGGSDTPENILRNIGIDASKGDFFREGLRAIEDDIDKLESLI